MQTYFRPPAADILGLIVLGMLILLIHQNQFLGRWKTRRFMSAAGSTVLILVLEILSDLVNHSASQELIVPAIVINVLGFSLMFMLPVELAALYSEKVARRKALFLIPAAIGAALCLASAWTGWIFRIDSAGIYHRGPLFLVNTGIALFGYAVFTYAHVDAAKEYDFREKVYLWTLYLVVLGATTVQLLDPLFELMWGGIAATEILYYVFLRELEYKLDAVTQVRNRVNFDRCLRELRLHSRLCIVAFDVNNLKLLNDTYGHGAGDVYLLESARIIREAYSDVGRVYRIGGDEFAVIGKDCTEAKLTRAREKLLALTAQFERETGIPYYIANAYAWYDPSAFRSAQDCLREADRRMYEDKKRSKQSPAIAD